VENLVACLSSGNPSCDGVSAIEIQSVQSWHVLSQYIVTGAVDMPVTALLVGLHNMITDTVPAQYLQGGQQNHYCPRSALKGMKSSILGGDEEVMGYEMPPYADVPGVPGLASTHAAINCPH